MSFDFIILIIVFSTIRKILQSKLLLPKLDVYFFSGVLLSIALLVADILFQQLDPLFHWINHVILVLLFYFCFKLSELKPVKPFIYALLPFAIINFVADAIKLIDKDFLLQYENYLEIALLFSLIWFFAMHLMNRKQRRDLAKEQQKAIEREKEFQRSEELKAALELQVAHRTAELLGQKNELQKALEELKITQNQLIHSEKMASLGELTAGIAHEIQNPLNFVNNFAEVSVELLDEMSAEIEKGDFKEAKAIANDVKQNLEKINHHGKRADAIVKGMLHHSRSSSGIKEPTDLNALCDEYLRLSYHGLRAKDKTFNAKMITDFDKSIGNVNIIPQDFGRVILNLLTNAFYAVNEKQKSRLAQAFSTPTKEGLNNEGIKNYEPTVTIRTKKQDNTIEIAISDNGNGMSPEIIDKIFQPFFTTKPTGKGTGLGLSMSYEIITKGHNGQLKVESTEYEGTTFKVLLNS